MHQRTGLTLVEVLVAIFIMGIGLIALLTLFPIGILRMAQAIRDERTSQAAGIAHSLGIMYDVRHDPSVVSVTLPFPPEADLFSNPGTLLPTPMLPADPFSESYAIYVDPIGYYSGNPGQNWVGNVPAYLRRRPVTYADFTSSIRTFKLWDDITFDSTFDPSQPGQRPGTPKVLAAPKGLPLTIQRDPVYSWAYLLRRPQTQDRSVVDCAIVVYDKRSTVTPGETVFENLAYFDVTRNTILVDITSLAPNIRPGDWIYDTTRYLKGTSQSTHSYFYRVVGAEDVPGVGASAGKLFAKYEVQSPIRGFTSGASLGSTIPAAQDPTRDPVVDPNTVYQGTIIVMDRVAEVFEKGPVRLP